MAEPKWSKRLVSRLRRNLTTHTLLVPRHVAMLLEGYSSVAYPQETGGILIGRYNKGQIHVTHVIGPGPHAVQTKNRFCRDGRHAKQELDRIFVKTAGESDYIGEWHCHPVSSPPSATDRDTMRRISEDRAHTTAQPVLVIVQRDLVGERWTLAGFVWNAGQLHPLTVHTPHELASNA